MKRSQRMLVWWLVCGGIVWPCWAACAQDKVASGKIEPPDVFVRVGLVRDELELIGVTVMTDEEAVIHVEHKIKERDDDARRWAEVTGEPLLDWVGKD